MSVSSFPSLTQMMGWQIVSGSRRNESCDSTVDVDDSTFVLRSSSTAGSGSGTSANRQTRRRSADYSEEVIGAPIPHRIRIFLRKSALFSVFQRTNRSDSRTLIAHNPVPIFPTSHGLSGRNDTPVAVPFKAIPPGSNTAKRDGGERSRNLRTCGGFACVYRWRKYGPDYSW
jgi:hypothetical protein